MSQLVSQARVLVTDSGVLQKDAYWYGGPWRGITLLHAVKGR